MDWDPIKQGSCSGSGILRSQEETTPAMGLLSSQNVGSPSIIKPAPSLITASEGIHAAAEALRYAANSYSALESRSVRAREHRQPSEDESQTSSGVESVGQSPQISCDELAMSSRPQSSYKSPHEFSQPWTPVRTNVICRPISGPTLGLGVLKSEKKAQTEHQKDGRTVEEPQKVLNPQSPILSRLSRVFCERIITFLAYSFSLLHSSSQKSNTTHCPLSLNIFSLDILPLDIELKFLYKTHLKRWILM